MVGIAQLVRALDCGSRGRRFDPDYPPYFFFPFYFNKFHNISNSCFLSERKLKFYQFLYRDNIRIDVNFYV